MPTLVKLMFIPVRVFKGWFKDSKVVTNFFSATCWLFRWSWRPSFRKRNIRWLTNNINYCTFLQRSLIFFGIIIYRRLEPVFVVPDYMNVEKTVCFQNYLLHFYHCYCIRDTTFFALYTTVATFLKTAFNIRNTGFLVRMKSLLKKLLSFCIRLT